MIKALLCKAQFDAELAEGFRPRWIAPRRKAVKEVLQSTIGNKELRPGARCALRTALQPAHDRIRTLSNACERGMFPAAMDGLRVGRIRTFPPDGPTERSSEEMISDSLKFGK